MFELFLRRFIYLSLVEPQIILVYVNLNDILLRIRQLRCVLLMHESKHIVQNGDRFKNVLGLRIVCIYLFLYIL